MGIDPVFALALGAFMIWAGIRSLQARDLGMLEALGSRGVAEKDAEAFCRLTGISLVAMGVGLFLAGALGQTKALGGASVIPGLVVFALGAVLLAFSLVRYVVLGPKHPRRDS